MNKWFRAHAMQLGLAVLALGVMLLLAIAVLSDTATVAAAPRFLNNRLPVLLTAGLPEGTPIAHKHGWVSTNGIINTIGDAGIIYSPGGDYVLVIFLNHPDQLIWEPASELVARLSQAVYNYYNLSPQAGT